MLHGFFFGFTLNTNLSIFKAKTLEESCFTAKLIEDGRFFLFQDVIGYISSNHGACYIKN